MTRSGPDPDRPDTPSAQVNEPLPEPDPDGRHTIRTESGDADYAVLLPLQKVIADVIRTTPVRAGNLADLDHLTAVLTLRVCVWVGRNVLPAQHSDQD